MPLLDVRNLTKDFGGLRANDAISFALDKDELLGVIGPNGAGKTTLFNCIAGLLRPTSGHAAVAGHDVVTDGRAARSKLGVVPQELALYEEMTATENLRFFGRLQRLGGKRLDEIDSVLEENAEEFVKNYVQKGGE